MIMDTIVYLMNCNILETYKDLYERCRRLCPRERKTKIDRLRFARDKRLSLTVYILFAMGSRRIFGYPAAPAMLVSDTGKPYTDVKDMNFNLSHSGSYGVCGFSDSPIGVDIERGIKGMERRDIRIWSCREAYCKYTGMGISQMPDGEHFGDMTYGCCHKYRGAYMFSKEVKGHVLSVCSLSRRVRVAEVSGRDLRSYLDEAERYISE